MNAEASPVEGVRLAAERGRLLAAAEGTRLLDAQAAAEGVTLLHATAEGIRLLHAAAKGRGLLHATTEGVVLARGAERDVLVAAAEGVLVPVASEGVLVLVIVVIAAAASASPTAAATPLRHFELVYVQGLCYGCATALRNESS